MSDMACTYSRVLSCCTTVPSIDAGRHALGVVSLIVAGKQQRKPYPHTTGPASTPPEESADGARGGDSRR